MSQPVERHRLRYRFCPHEDEVYVLEAGARVDADLHNGLVHHDDGRECATVEQLTPAQAREHRTEATP